MGKTPISGERYELILIPNGYAFQTKNNSWYEVIFIQDKTLFSDFLESPYIDDIYSISLNGENRPKVKEKDNKREF